MTEKSNWVADFAKGCAFRLTLLALMVAGFYVLLCLRPPFPTLLLFADGAEVAAPIAGFFMWFAVLYVLYARQNEADIALLQKRGLRDGERALVCGIVRPMGPLLAAPFSGKECVGYYYTATHRTSPGRSGSTTWTDYEGYALAPFAIRSPLGDVRILAEADKGLFYELSRENLGDAYERAGAYLGAADFGETITSVLGGKSRTRETVNGPGDFRVDISIDPPRDPRTCDLEEKIIRPGEAVYAVGVYSAERGGLIADPNILNTPFHIVRGGEKALRRKTRLRLAGAAVCAGISLAVVAFYFLVHVPENPGRIVW
ncbi:MAG: hypothetical protein A2V83_05530 [Nitrospirae bacterium RBG_16_64_22]|nr:MAG: hypothetical protein A2V83_05530 [Nitrospirae bacterium RBG_16_64_22]